jgi:hypothetical protein
MARPKHIAAPMVGLTKSPHTRPVAECPKPPPMVDDYLEHVAGQLSVTERATTDAFGHVLATARASLPVATLEMTHGRLAYLRHLAAVRRRLRKKDPRLIGDGPTPKQRKCCGHAARKPAKENVTVREWPEWCVMCNCANCHEELRSASQPNLPDRETLLADAELRKVVKRFFKLKAPVRHGGRAYCPTCAKRRGVSCPSETGPSGKSAGWLSAATGVPA